MFSFPESNTIYINLILKLIDSLRGFIVFDWVAGGFAAGVNE